MQDNFNNIPNGEPNNNPSPNNQQENLGGDRGFNPNTDYHSNDERNLNANNVYPPNETGTHNPQNGYNLGNEGNFDSNPYSNKNAYGDNCNNPNSQGTFVGAPTYVNNNSSHINENNNKTNKPNTKKPKKNIGKIIFITIICISVIAASVALGSSITYNKIKNTDEVQEEDKSNSTTTNGDAAVPNVENSPNSFSEYSGKGAMTPEQVYQSVKEINVGILVYSQNQKIGEGSGIIVGEDKAKQNTYILTAAHVISDTGVNIQVQFYDESEADAQIVGFDTKTDIGVIKVKKVGFKKASFGNSDKLTVGQTVYAIGNPGGTEFFGSFTSGMISAIDRPIPTSNSAYDLPCIQHNAAINPGNSGGALVNEYGQVIGLNSSKISSTEYEGMGFSVPSNTMLEIYNEIVAHGYVSNRPMLGITYFPVSADFNYSSIAWKNKLPYGSIAIATISKDSDVAKTNITEGDIVTAVNGKPLETTDVLLETIEQGKVGDKLKLTIFRLNNSGDSGTTFEVTVKLVEDRGNTVTPQKESAPSKPFGGYFEGFDY